LTIIQFKDVELPPLESDGKNDTEAQDKHHDMNNEEPSVNSPTPIG
jgi:hypothetical protein